MAALAAKVGLVATNTSDNTCAQMTFTHPENRWHDTRIIWTRVWDQGTYRFEIMWAMGECKKFQGKNNLECWLKAIAPSQ
jgi:hypothetical protein